jgi:hypothetical protein
MKKKVIKDYKSLPPEIREAIREKYPQGYVEDVITFFNKEKQLISALPYETEEISYLIKMPSSMNLEEDEETTASPIEAIPEKVRIEDIEDEKYLMQEEEEESD